MLGLLLLLITGLMLTYILKGYRADIGPEDVLPPYVMTLLLFLYALAILKKVHHAYFLSLCFFALIFAAFLFLLIRRIKNAQGKLRVDKALLVNLLKEHAGFILFLVLCVLVCWCYSTHFVLVWDDFHYNATFPKNCYTYGTMPTGSHLATHYKSYLPLLQLFFYWGFQGSGFSETLMFDYKMVLIYVLLLPFFKRIPKLKIASAIALSLITAILPFLFLYEVQESLSMDTVMGLLFAYAVIGIASEKERDLIDYYGILVSLLCLTLIK